MDKDLYEALQQAYEHKRGRLSVLLPNSETDEDRKAFDRLVSALHKLRDLGFVKFKDEGQVRRDNMRNDYSYLSIACEFTYDAENALSYRSYEAYQKSLQTDSAFEIKVDQSFNNYGAIHHSNIATHSHYVQQTLNNDSGIENLFQKIIETLKQDQSLAENQQQELLEDIQSLKRELQRIKPRSGMITELYSTLGNTASIASYLPQLQTFIQHFLP